MAGNSLPELGVMVRPSRFLKNARADEEPRGTSNAAKAAKASYPRDAADWMKSQGCWDERSCNPEFYGGDLWIVEENHPRKAAILARNKAVYYSGQTPMEELLKDEKYKRLLAPPKQMVRA